MAINQHQTSNSSRWSWNGRCWDVTDDAMAGVKQAENLCNDSLFFNEQKMVTTIRNVNGPTTTHGSNQYDGIKIFCKQKAGNDNNYF